VVPLWTAYLVAYEFPYKLIVAPIFLIIPAVALILMLKQPSLTRVVGTFLFFLGAVETLSSPRIMFMQGFFIGLATWVFGFILLVRSSSIKSHLVQRGRGVLKKAVYVVLAFIIFSSSLVLSVRATTNLLREDHLANYTGSTNSNLVLRGTITEVQLNHEEKIAGYVYHVFHACGTLNVTGFVWSGQMYSNETSTADYWLNIGTVEVYYDYNDASKLAAGQYVEVKGCYCPWIEDSLYSGKLVVDPIIPDSYIKVNS
jgi:hypothetical protein